MSVPEPPLADADEPAARRLSISEIPDDLPCGRLGRHEPHAWLTRPRLRCAGTGVPGSAAPPPLDLDGDTGAEDNGGDGGGGGKGGGRGRGGRGGQAGQGRRNAGPG